MAAPSEAAFERNWLLEQETAVSIWLAGGIEKAESEFAVEMAAAVGIKKDKPGA